jgi:hypothetical protein
MIEKHYTAHIKNTLDATSINVRRPKPSRRPDVRPLKPVITPKRSFLTVFFWGRWPHFFEMFSVSFRAPWHGAPSGLAHKLHDAPINNFEKRRPNLRRKPLKIETLQNTAEMFVGPSLHLSNFAKVVRNGSQFTGRDFLKCPRTSTP